MSQNVTIDGALPRHKLRNFAYLAKMIPGLQLGIDSIVLISLGFISYYSLVHYSYKTADIYVLAIFTNWLLTVMFFHFGGLYQFTTVLRPWSSTSQIVIAVVTSFLMMLAAAFTVKISDQVSRIWMATLFLGSIVWVIGERAVVSLLLHKLMERHIIARRIAVLGQAPQISRFVDFVKRSAAPYMSITAIFLDEAKPVTAQSHKFGYPVLGDLDKLVSFVRTENVDDIVIAMPWSEAARISQIVESLRELPTNVHLTADLAGFSLPMNPPASYFEAMPIYQVVGKPLSGWDVVIKAVIDYVLASALLIFLSPIFLAVAVLIKLDSSGPVFFRQKRLGFNNQAFDIFKFRSMRTESEPVKKTIQATENDPRITAVGRILRRTSIDELPQLLNVLNGTMSLVGPRPHAIDHNEDFAQKIRGYFGRHRMKPGITGLAQVKGHRGLTDTVEKMEARVKYDIQYTESWSPLLDLRILIMTPFAVLFGKNAV